MQYTRAIRIAIAAIDAQIKRLATNANLHDQYHADAPACVQASKQRADLIAARALLQKARE